MTGGAAGRILDPKGPPSLHLNARPGRGGEPVGAASPAAVGVATPARGDLRPIPAAGADPVAGALDDAPDEAFLEAPVDPKAARTDPATAKADPGPADRRTTVVCIANQKGGVGKTTTCTSLAAALAAEGARVLVVDLDPQGNATTGLGLRIGEGAPSTYRVVVEGMALDEAVVASDLDGLDVLPSSLDLAGAEVELVPAFSRELRLRRALEAARDRYDIVLVDCPPSLGLLTINALVASDEILVPIQCEYYALEGLGQLLRTVKLVRDSLNRSLTLGGVVLTMFDGRTRLSQQVVDEVRGYFGGRAYQTIIPRTVRLSEAPSYGQPITVFDPVSRGARAYQRLAREVGERLGLELAPEHSPLDRLLGGASSPARTGVDRGGATLPPREEQRP